MINQSIYFCKSELDSIVKEYNHKYQTNLDNDIKDSFPNEVSRIALKMLHKNSSEYD